MTYASEVSADSPVLWWKLDDASGNASASAGTVTGTASGTITRSQSPLILTGTSWTFASGAFVQSAATAVGSTNTTTAELWVKTTGTSQVVLAANHSNGGTHRWHMFMQADGKVKVEYTGVSGAPSAVSTTAINDGNRHQVVLRQDSSTLTVWVDGVQEASVGNTLVTGAAENQFVWLCRSSAFSATFVGTLDEFSIYSTALSSTRIAAHYTAGTTAPTLGGTLGITTETDGAQPIGRKKVRTLGVATESDSAVHVTTPGSHLVNPATETDGAQPIGRRKVYTVNPATGTNAAQALGRVKRRTIGTAGETDSGVHIGSGGIHVTLGVVTETDTAQPIAVSKVSRATTIVRNRATGSRFRSGTGYASITVPVDPEPVVIPNPVATITAPVEIAADTLPAMSVVGSEIPAVEATEVRGSWGRFRVRIGNHDVTFYRGIPTEVVDYQLTDPYGWGPGTINVPSVYFTEISAASDSIPWLRQGAPVDLDRVVNGNVVGSVYHGIVESIGCAEDGTVTLELSGALSGVLAKRWRPQRLTRGTADPAFLLSVAIEGQIARTYRKTDGWYDTAHNGRVGFEVENFDGGMTFLAFADKILAECVTPAGDSWTILPTGNYREVDLVERNLTDVDATIYYGARGVSAPLVNDASENTNRFWGEGVDNDGSRWRNAFYPQTTAALASDGSLIIPDYPFTDGRTFGIGTSNGDTDTGDGIRVLQNELIGSGVGFRLLDRSNTYNQATADAVATAQTNAGLPATGEMNPATWTMLMGDAAATWSLGQATIRPLVFDPRTERFLYNQNGSVIGRNPQYDRTVEPVDRHYNFGTGWSKERARRWLQREYNRAQRSSWRGTITLTSDVIAGSHTFGDPATPMSRLDIRAGMNVRLRGFGSTPGIVLHVSAVQVSIDDQGPTVSLTVDTHGRPAVDIAAILQRDEESRGNLARRAYLEHRRGSIQSDAIIGASREDGFGVVRRTPLKGQQWNEIKVIGGQSGTLQAVKLQTSDEAAEFACLVTARSVSTTRLDRMVAEPLALVGPSESTPGSVSTNLAEGVAIGKTRLPLERVSGLPSSYPYDVTISPDAASEETVTVTGRVDKTLIVSALSKDHDKGAVVRYSVAAETLDPNDPAEVWTQSEIADLLYSQKWGLYMSGTGADPLGYFPRRKYNTAGNPSGHPITGRHEDSAGASFWTLSRRSPWLYLYVWPDRDCYIEGGEDGYGLIIQIDEGA